MRKKYIVIIIILIIIYVVIPKQDDVEEQLDKTNQEEFRGVFFSYIELSNYIKDKTEKESKDNIDSIIEKVKQNNFNTIILQIRSHADSIYQSQIFPISKNIRLKNGTYYDVLDYFIKKSRQKGIKIFCWINPYRIGNNIDTSSKYYEMVGEENIKKVGDNYYFNPSSSKVEELIVEEVGEVVEKYKIEAIMFDDYFYPSNDIDKEEYKNKNLDISIEQYHLKVINNMVEKVRNKIKKTNKNILFGISPEGNIENNYNKNYADVKEWVKSDKYIDFVMPQIYYGFINSVKPYKNTIEEWNNIITSKNIRLYVALSFYKVGKIDDYANEGKMEWIENSDIIKRQIVEARILDKYRGFSVFRYDNLFNENNYTENTVRELEEMKKIM